MEFLKNFIMGLVSGIAEFLPISSAAHRQITGVIFGTGASDPARNLFIHIAVLFAVYSATAKKRERLKNAARKQRRKKNGTNSDSLANAEYKLLRTATLPLLIIFFLLIYLLPIHDNLIITSLLLLVNGILIFLPDRMLQGNKNAKVITPFDAVFIGIAGALSAFPGFSRIGCVMAAAALRGADKKSSGNWALMLSIPALTAWILIDLISLFTWVGIPFWSNLIFYLIGGFSAYLGSRLGIYGLRKHIRINGCAGYAYYCWGASLLTLILFLTVV